jgi:hypothetical protein
MSQKLEVENSRGGDILEVMRRKLERDRCLRGYVLRIILF